MNDYHILHRSQLWATAATLPNAVAHVFQHFMSLDFFAIEIVHSDGTTWDMTQATSLVRPIPFKSDLAPLTRSLDKSGPLWVMVNCIKPFMIEMAPDRYGAQIAVTDRRPDHTLIFPDMWLIAAPHDSPYGSTGDWNHDFQGYAFFQSYAYQIDPVTLLGIGGADSLTINHRDELETVHWQTAMA